MKVYGARGILGIAAMTAVALSQMNSPVQAEPLPADPVPVDPNKVPKRLDINSTPREVCKAWRVFFNGVEQRACIIADREKGYILRYKTAIGSMPVRGRSGKYETEHLKGIVEFRAKVESV